MLRVLLGSRVAVAVIPASSRRFFALDVHGGQTIDKREKTLEDKTVRDHDKKLLDDLVKNLAKKDEMLKRAEAALKSSGGGSAAEATRSQAEALGNEIDDKLLTLRKEIRDEIRLLEDKLDAMDYRIKRIEKRIGI